MGKIEEILKSKHEPKEKITLLAKEIKKDKKFIGEIVGYFESAPAGDQGHLIESLEYASQDNPEIIAPHLDFVICHLEDKAPRVKWECARIIANLTLKFSDKTVKAIPALLKNAKDKGTVVRWSVAFALGEIAKSNSNAERILLPKMKELIKKETNNGVKNVYLKTLKFIEKKKK
ncbi:HEAT repeat domain-containing protein [Patescibacteria group bacterium]|nr:HEAT repeat domain-containing protein [Patescibacteria group bacterium]MBU4481404.1 HEAT repeat domain-containing protein [Patescibacteria group bacterium]